MTPIATPSPVSLSYATAIRGFVPRQPGTAFSYALFNCSKPELLTCLAASNPEGQFFGFVGSAAKATEAENEARALHVENVTFASTTITDVLSGSYKGLPQLNYLCIDETQIALTEANRAALFDVAKKHLLPGGLLNYSYNAYTDAAGPLRFLIREFGPEMSAEQANGFLHELKVMGASFFASRPDLAAKLESAIAKKMPDEFFSAFDDGESRSKTFDTIVALKPRGFSFAGASQISDNYGDFAMSAEAQAIVLSCSENHLYEPIKDFALNRLVRSDIWSRGPDKKSSNVAELFGGFTFGILANGKPVPMEVKTIGQTINLSSLLYRRLIDLMTLMPLSVGDFLSHPDGQGFTADAVVVALQILVACNIAQPMRGTYQTNANKDIIQPRFAGAFNRSLGQKQLDGQEMLFASPVLGNAVSVSANEALVMQALDRVGIENSVSALLPELERLAKSPALRGHITDVSTPTAANAQDLIKEIVGRSIVQWYAYGLLEAV